MVNCDLKKNERNKICLKQVGEAIFSIIIPKSDNSNNSINQKSVKKYVNKINSEFGGSTTKPVTLGCWSDEKREKLQCETGTHVSGYVDFDSPYDAELNKMNVSQRKANLQKSYKFMKKVAKEMANEFGQDSIPVIYDNVRDISFIQGTWKKKLNKKYLSGKKSPKDPFKKYV